jgi:hypothetical protein
LSNVPLTPLALRMLCAVVALSWARALENSVWTFGDGVVELPVEEFDDELAVADPGVIGCAELFFEPNPTAAASVPLPTTAIESLLFLLVITSLPPETEAVTCALVGRSTLMALTRSPIVSVPVDV